MEVAEIYWKTVQYIGDILEICITGYFFCRFVKPFLPGCRRISWIGIIYSLVMLFLLFIPYDLSGSVENALGVAAVFITMYLLDKRTVEQKVFLAVTCYLLEWISWGMLVAVWNFLCDVSMWFSIVRESVLMQFVDIVILRVLWLVMQFWVMKLFVWLLHKAYGCKAGNMTKKELILILAPFLSFVLGRELFRYFNKVYELDMSQYIWVNHHDYNFLLFLYQTVTFAAMLTVVIIYQSIKDSQRREKEETVLARQLEDTQRHISEVEKLYRDIRSLKHDMGNHVMILEHLYGKEANAEEYVAQWKRQIEDTALPGKINSGNPVMDIIIGEKLQEAEEKEIDFQYDFHYPEGTKLNAFDVSVILSNAMNNAMEAAVECVNPYVHVVSYRENNAFMIEIRNSMVGKRALDEGCGLPVTTKKEDGHGFGLTNIRKVAQKYYGDIVIEQNEKEFVLVVMLMTQ